MKPQPKLPAGTWIDFDTVAKGLGISFADLRARTAELGITPIRIPGSLRYYSVADVQRLNIGRLVSLNDFPARSPEQVRAAKRAYRISNQKDPINYPDGWVSTKDLAKILGIHIARVREYAVVNGIGMMKLPGSILAFNQRDAYAYKAAKWRRESAQRPAPPKPPMSGLDANGIPASRLASKIRGAT